MSSNSRKKYKWYTLSAGVVLMLYLTLPQTEPYTILPQKYLKSVAWNVSIIDAPPCPPAAQIYLIKTSPYNFELRRLSRLMLQKQGGVASLFVIGTRDKGNGSNSNYTVQSIQYFCSIAKFNSNANIKRNSLQR